MHGALMAESPNGAIRSGENGINIYLWCALIIPNKVCVSKEFILGSREKTLLRLAFLTDPLTFRTKKCVRNDRAWSVMGIRTFQKSFCINGSGVSGPH